MFAKQYGRMHKRVGELGLGLNEGFRWTGIVAQHDRPLLAFVLCHPGGPNGLWLRHVGGSRRREEQCRNCKSYCSKPSDEELFMARALNL